MTFESVRLRKVTFESVPPLKVTFESVHLGTDSTSVNSLTSPRFKCNGHGDRCVGLAFVYVGHTHSTRRQMYIVCVCVSSTLRVPFRYPSGSLLRSKLDPLASMGWFAAAWALLAVAPGPYEPEAR